MGGTTLIALPYDSGRFDERMGRGPLHLLESGLKEQLRALEPDLDVAVIRPPENFYAEAEALVALQKLAVDPGEPGERSACSHSERELRPGGIERGVGSRSVDDRCDLV
jgi:hypothetical protein